MLKEADAEMREMAQEELLDLKEKKEEIEENEFNLNIPRYVDTFLPEENVDLDIAVKEFKAALVAEENSLKEFNIFLTKLSKGE